MSYCKTYPYGGGPAVLQPVACLPSGDGFSAGIFSPCSDSGLLSIIMVSDPDVESDVSFF